MSCGGLAGLELEACRAAEALTGVLTRGRPPLAGMAELVTAAGWLALGVAALVLVWRLAPRLAETLGRDDWHSLTFGFGGAEVSATRGAEKTAQLMADLQSKTIDLATALEGRAEPPGDGFAPPPVPAAEPLPRLSILWVDGTPSNVAFERSILESLGHSVHFARSTEAARAWLRDAPTADVVISDLDRSPEESALAGLDLHRWLREAGIRGSRDEAPIRFALYTQPENVAAHQGDLADDPESFATSSLAALRSRLRWLQYDLRRRGG